MISQIINKKNMANLVIIIITYYICKTIIGVYYNLFLILPVLAGIYYLAHRKPLLFIIFAVIIYEQFFQTRSMLYMRPWFYADLTVMFIFGGIAVQLMRTNFRLNLGNNNYYFWFILLILSIIFFTIFFGSYLIHDQPPETLIFRARPFFLYFVFLYLCLTDFSPDQIYKFIQFLAVSAVIISILVIIDAKLLGGGIIFKMAMNNGISGMRGGSVRLVLYSFVTIFAYFYFLAMIKFSKDSTIKLLSFLSWLIILFQLVFCFMTRQVLLMIFMTTLLFLLNIKNMIFKVIVYATLAGVFLFSVLFGLSNPDLVYESSYYKLFEKTRADTAGKETGNITHRLNGIKFFYPYFEETFYLGMGMSTIRSETSPVAAAAKQGYLFTDLGLFAILFRFGIF